MAQQDITGLLTGMFSGDPAALNQKLLAQKAVASNPNLLTCVVQDRKSKSS